MRFPLAALFFMVLSFVFFIIWGTMTYLLDETRTALLPMANANATAIINDIQTGFGIIAALFFVVGLLLVFFLDATADEPEIYWRER